MTKIICMCCMFLKNFDLFPQYKKSTLYIALEFRRALKNLKLKIDYMNPERVNM